MACACRHACNKHETSRRPPTPAATRRWWIDLVAGRWTARVELRKLVAVRVDGRDVVRLDDLWAAAHLGVAVEELSFDFVADDGFHVSAREPAGIAGGDLATGYVCVVTRDLVWQPTPERPCFWRVKGVAQIVGTRRSLAAPSITAAGG